MPKPTDLPVWATDAAYDAPGEDWDTEDTKVEPSVERQEEGWEPESFPPAEELNWWQNLVYQWILYLDAGEFEGDVSIEGNLEVGGRLDVVGDVATDGEFTYATPRFRSHYPTDAHATSGTFGVGVSSHTFVYTLSDGGVVYIPVQGLRRGDELLSVMIQGAAVANNPTLTLYRQSAGFAAVSVATTNTGTVTANGGTLMTLNSPYTLVGDEKFHLRVTISGETLEVHDITPSWRHLF